MVLGKFRFCLKEPASLGPQRDKLRDRKTRKVPGTPALTGRLRTIPFRSERPVRENKDKEQINGPKSMA